MKKLLFLVVIIFTFISCDDFLEEDPRGQFMEDSYFNTVDDIERFMPSLFYYFQTTIMMVVLLICHCAVMI
jgi:hypothetical protein